MGNQRALLAAKSAVEVQTYALGITLDQSDNAYVCGYTTSIEISFPVNIGPGLTFKGDYDALIAKIRITQLPLDQLLPE